MNKSIKRPMFRPETRPIKTVSLEFPRHSFIESDELTLHAIHSVSVVGVDWVKFYERVPWGPWMLDPTTPGVSTAVMAEFICKGHDTYYTILIVDSLITPDYIAVRMQGSPFVTFSRADLGLTTCDLRHLMSYLLGSSDYLHGHLI